MHTGERLTGALGVVALLLCVGGCGGGSGDAGAMLDQQSPDPSFPETRIDKQRIELGIPVRPRQDRGEADDHVIALGHEHVTIRNVLDRQHDQRDESAGDESALCQRHAPPLTWNPASAMTISPVTARDAGLRRNSAASATSARSTLRRSGARSRYT